MTRGAVAVFLSIVLAQVRAAEPDSARCQAGDAPACVRLGARLRDAHPPRAVSARDAFRRACDAGEARGCREFGAMLARGLGGPGDRARGAASLLDARARFEAVCSGGDAHACAEAADLYAFAENPLTLLGHADDRRARALYTRACDGGDARACGRLARYFLRGAGADRARADALWARACDGGDASGCAEVAAAIADTDAPRARALFERACEQGERLACARLGAIVAASDASPAALDRAATLFDRACSIAHGSARNEADALRARAFAERACDGGDLLRCARLAALLDGGPAGPRTDGDIARAAALVARACEGGVIAGCTALGVRLREGRGVAWDNARAASLLGASCRSGDLAGCAALGSLREADGDAPDLAAARALYTRACDGGMLAGCTALGALYEEGRGVVRDASVAAGLYDAACGVGEARACIALASLHQRGVGVAVNLERASGLLDRAGQLADDEATSTAASRARMELFSQQSEGAPATPPPSATPAATPPVPDEATLRAAFADPRTRVEARDAFAGLPRYELTRRRLANGLDVVLARGGEAGVVEASLTVRVGHADAPAARPGLAHVVEHLALRASCRAATEVLTEMARLGAPRGNAETTDDRTEFWLAADRGSLERALWLLGNVLGQDEEAFSEATLAHERRVIAHEMQGQLAGWRALTSRLLETALPDGHPMRRAHPVDDGIGAVTRDEALSFFRRWYTTSNAQLVVVGDLDPAATIAAVERYFASIADRPTPRREPRAVALTARGERELRGSTPNGRDRVAYVWSGGGAEGPDAIAWTAAIAALTHGAPTPPLFGASRVEVVRLNGLVGAVALVGEVAPGRTQEAALRGLATWLTDGLDRTLGEALLEPSMPEVIEALTRSLYHTADDLRARTQRIARWPDADDPGAFRRELTAIRALRADDIRAVVRDGFDPQRHATLRITHDPGRADFAEHRR